MPMNYNRTILNVLTNDTALEAIRSASDLLVNSDGNVFTPYSCNSRVKKTYCFRTSSGVLGGGLRIESGHDRDFGDGAVCQCELGISYQDEDGDTVERIGGYWFYHTPEAIYALRKLGWKVEHGIIRTLGEFRYALLTEVMSIEIPTKYHRAHNPRHERLSAERSVNTSFSRTRSNRIITSEGLWHIENQEAFEYYSSRQNLDRSIGYHDHDDPYCDWFCEQNEISFGIELETQSAEINTNRMVEIFNEDLRGRARPERDGSLFTGDYVGVEFIFQPHSYNKLRELMPTLKTSFRKMRNNGIVSYDTGDCGCHIHTSRSGWGQTAETQINNVAKATGFITHFKNFMKKVFERGQVGFCQWCPTDNFEEVRLWVSDISHCHGTSVECSKTFEFRYPRGCLNTERLWATIDLLNAFAKNSQVIEINDYDPVKWLNGITAETKDFLRRKGCFLAALD